jgi:hypothetical protein
MKKAFFYVGIISLLVSALISSCSSSHNSCDWVRSHYGGMK